ncbi:hypothetical protein GX563_04525 [Candidatus Bathyarchaeota archaeon]|nr:hypothetical protein [Candidatus Bathyarchaeota archaeon]
MKRKPLPENQRVFTFVSASALLFQPATAAKAMNSFCTPVACLKGSPSDKKPAPNLTAGICEFVGDYVFSGSSGRKCFDGTFCPVSVYGKLTVYQTCPTRLVKLREREEQP